MNKLLPLERWEIMPITEREALSDTDSDEKNSNYEEVVISKVKRKRDIEEENSKVKRTKLSSKLKIPKMHPSHAIPANKSPKRRPRVSKGAPGPPLGKLSKRFKPSKSKSSSISSRR